MYNPYNPYQSMQSPYQSVYNQYQPQQPTMPPMPRQEILKVNGRNGIDMLNMSPNSSLLALDSTAPIVWLVQTDGAGYKTPAPYKIEPYQEQKQNDSTNADIIAAFNSLDARVAKLEGMVHNDESNSASNRKTKSSAGKSATDKVNDGNA